MPTFREVYQAAANGDIASFINEYGIDAQDNQDGTTLFMNTMLIGDIDQAKELVRLGANINLVDNYGMGIFLYSGMGAFDEEKSYKYEFLLSLEGIDIFSPKNILCRAITSRSYQLVKMVVNSIMQNPTNKLRDILYTQDKELKKNAIELCTSIRDQEIARVCKTLELTVNPNLLTANILKIYEQQKSSSNNVITENMNNKALEHSINKALGEGNDGFFKDVGRIRFFRT